MKNSIKNKRLCSVLVCDDSDVIRRGLQRLLRTNPEFHVVDEAADGQECVEKVRQLKPDLVLMDVRMPELDGIEATRQLTLAAPETKVLAHSADAEWATAERMLSAGAAGYVVKGSEPGELFRAMRTILAGGHYLSAALLESPDESD